MFINNKEVVGEFFAYDGCHKIYVLETDEEVKEAIEAGYEVHRISQLPTIYEESCDLRFIRNWNLDVAYARQFEEVEFDEEGITTEEQEEYFDEVMASTFYDPEEERKEKYTDKELM